MRRTRLESFTRYAPKHVTVLMRISDVYTKPCVELYADPWRLVTSDKLSFAGNTKLQAVLSEAVVPDFKDMSIDVFPRHHLQYKALPGNHIRLLCLLPATSETDDLKAVIEHVPIGATGDYRALSYVWGSSKSTSELETPMGRVGITTSLSCALRHLRRINDPLTLWVDAVCINQEDNDEKIRQIRLLPRIFQRATSVTAFLDKGKVHDRAIETLMQINAKAQQSDSFVDLEGPSGKPHMDRGLVAATNGEDGGTAEEEAFAWPECLPAVPKLWASKPVPPPQDPIWNAIHDFFANPWFRRAWVIQEIVFASSIRVICGKWIVEWNDLFGAMETIDHEICTSSEYSVPNLSWSHFLQIATHREREARKTRLALINLLESFRHAESTLTRDRFFSLLGFAADSENPAFEPDYTSSLEVVILRFAHAFIVQGKIMLLLHRAGFEAKHEPSAARFPSWVPNWTTPRQPCLSESSHRGVQFAASWKTIPRVQTSSSLSEIAVHGASVDTVSQISEATCTPSQLGRYLKELEGMVHGLTHLSLAEKEELTWQLPVAEAKYPRTTPDMETDLRTSYEALKKVFSISVFA